MATNRWSVGSLYPEGGLHDIAWSQPGGPGTRVFPQQQTGQDYFSTKPFSELSGVFVSPCGHYQDNPTIQREYDYDTNQSCALVQCSLCGYVAYVIEPFEDALSTIQYPWVTI